MIARLAPIVVIFFAATGARGASVQFQIDVSRAPDTAVYAEQCKVLCDEWYPKIHEILFGPAVPIPDRVVKLIIEPRSGAGFTSLMVGQQGVTYSIHISSEWIKRPHTLDYRSLVIHELAHIVQSYIRVRTKKLSWLEEGIADYVTYTYYTKTNEPALRLDENGCLKGYTDAIPYLFGLQENRVKIGRKAYRHGYTVASAFFLWLEIHKDKDIVRRLNAALSTNHYSEKLFRRHCGASLDNLWQEFLDQSRSRIATRPARISEIPLII